MCIDMYMVHTVYIFATDVGLIVGCVVGGVVVLAIAMMLAIVALYYLKRDGGKVTDNKEKSDDIDDIDPNFFAASMPPFKGSML